MTPIDYARHVLRRYPALAWMPDAKEALTWQVDGQTVRIQPAPGSAMAEKWGHYFPVEVIGERVALPAFGIDRYPSAHARADLADGPTHAMVFVANRFYRMGGHSFLYLHYPDHPADDKIINFSNGPTSLGQFGMKRDVDFVHSPADGVTDPLLRGVTSFAGFPITERQARVIEADATLAMCNPHYIRYALFNQGANALNCVGFALSRLQNAQESLAQLTGKHRAPRPVDNDSLPDYRLTLPGSVHRDIRDRIRESTDRTVLPIQHPEGGAPDTELLLARSPDGLLLGETRRTRRPIPGQDQYLAHDMVAVMDHLLPQVLSPSAEVKPLNGLALSTFVGTPLNRDRQPTVRGLS